MIRHEFLGREAVLDILDKSRQADKLGQPFLLVGPDGSGKETTALEFARRLNCVGGEACTADRRCESCVKALSHQHPDIHWIGPAPAAIKEAEVRHLLDAKMENPFFQPAYAGTAQISIGDPEHPGPLSIRSIIHFLRRRAFQSAYKVAIVSDGQRLNAAAANAFLKTLEEPPPQTVILLLANSTDGMLPTIISRCRKVLVDPWTEDELTRILVDMYGADPDAAARSARTADGSARRAIALLEEGAQALVDWAGRLFEWIHAGDRAEASIAADELHRGLFSHTLDVGKPGKDNAGDDTLASKRGRAIQLCEMLNLHYSDAVRCLELQDDWIPRLAQARDLVARAAARRTTGALLQDMESIEDARLEIDRNLNIGLVMAVLFEGLIDNVEREPVR